MTGIGRTEPPSPSAEAAAGVVAAGECAANLPADPPAAGGPENARRARLPGDLPIRGGRAPLETIQERCPAASGLFADPITGKYCHVLPIYPQEQPERSGGRQPGLWRIAGISSRHATIFPCSAKPWRVGWPCLPVFGWNLKKEVLADGSVGSDVPERCGGRQPHILEFRWTTVFK